MFYLHNLIGGLGFVLLLGTYLLLQLNRIEAQSLLYSLLNALGAALLLVSLAFDFNLSAVLVESSWLVISLIGIAVTLVDKGRCKERDAP
ncbi:MAG: hypothetical protein VXZ82_16310 [Planctomycetota bacterium]|nr:hypothetical protein [Planctomycetota bacterium]